MSNKEEASYTNNGYYDKAKFEDVQERAMELLVHLKNNILIYAPTSAKLNSTACSVGSINQELFALKREYEDVKRLVVSNNNNQNIETWVTKIYNLSERLSSVEQAIAIHSNRNENDILKKDIPNICKNNEGMETLTNVVIMAKEKLKNLITLSAPAPKSATSTAGSSMTANILREALPTNHPRR